MLFPEIVLIIMLKPTKLHLCSTEAYVFYPCVPVIVPFPFWEDPNPTCLHCNNLTSCHTQVYLVEASVNYGSLKSDDKFIVFLDRSAVMVRALSWNGLK